MSHVTLIVNVENFPGFPTRILGPELMDKFHEEPLRFGTRIITETIPKIDLSAPSGTLNVQTGSKKDLAVNGLFYAPGYEPANGDLSAPNSKPIQTSTLSLYLDWTQTSVRGVFTDGDVQDRRYRQVITSVGSGCMAGLQVERLIAEEDGEKGMMGE
ncbi:hypothetical protein K435DRAFT_791778 [Dendrothele bispora CBS 962.96]|uniref:FAD/NAD(P)-binding domain-containing protein n=1 Tax=Dendrothele bispora (strain CBS 962.96) TaxID=1314807 RepID=A0A4S8MMF6_DENBC|nr:hypothetical protein K435DRAFT_791778 [Dendrothele bispora CBS 962.96]